MTSDTTFLPQRFTLIDELSRDDHSYLTEDDVCYFLGEYTARKGYTHSKTNDLILNFKKSVSLHGTSQWRWKEWAIQQSADAFRAALYDKDLDTITFVPVPPSKAKDDPLYDDRLIRMLRAIRPAPDLDIRELVIQRQSMAAAHESERRPTPCELEAIYEINERCLAPRPMEIAIVDDVLTTGLHFRAMNSHLERAFPDVKIIGLFIARRSLGPTETEDP